MLNSKSHVVHIDALFPCAAIKLLMSNMILFLFRKQRIEAEINGHRESGNMSLIGLKGSAFVSLDTKCQTSAASDTQVCVAPQTYTHFSESR